MNRYYSSTFGRFMTADPYRGSAGSVPSSTNPRAWNRYSYVVSDPIGFLDRTGLITHQPDGTADDDDDDDGDIPPPAPKQKMLPAEQEGSPPIPAYLLVVADCTYDSLLRGTFLRRTYQLLDDLFEPLVGVQVFEQISNVTPTGNTIAGGGRWTTALVGPFDASFMDFYTDGSNSTPTNALQDYYTMVGATAIHLTVLEPNGHQMPGRPDSYDQYGTQGSITLEPGPVSTISGEIRSCPQIPAI